MKRLQAIGFVLLMTVFPSVYAGDCWDGDVNDCRAKAEQGDAAAQFNLGVMYYRGEGVAQDDKAAVKWYTKAAEQGHVGAQTDLGLMYESGQGVAQDYVMAHMFFNIAAIDGLKPAIENRDIAAKRMTTAQIAEAQKLARDVVVKTELLSKANC